MGEVRAILSDAAALPRWWPDVYLRVDVLEPGDADGVGRVVHLWTKGRLPYSLRWSFRVEDADVNGSRIRCWGDFEGSGVWRWRQDGDDVDVTYDWKVVAQKPLFRALSWLLKPAFSANHRWAMARGEESLRRELERRRATGRTAREPAPEYP